MTAEIAIFNKGAIALAADSAVTIGTRDRSSKVYNTVNKLFTLSKFHPMGIMVYDNASFMNIPWEILIKLYRKRLGDCEFATVEAYRDDFLTYLKDEAISHISPEIQKAYVYRKLQSTLQSLSETHPGETMASEKVRTFHRRLKLTALNVNLPEGFANTFWGLFRQIIDGLVQELFPTATSETKYQAGQIAEMLFTKSVFQPGLMSGVVFAGYGKEQIFPAVSSINIEGIIGDALLWQAGKSASVDDNSPAVIIPFAQDREVVTFVEGVDKGYRDFLMGYVGQLLSGLPESITALLSPLVPNIAQHQPRLAEMAKNLRQKFFQETQQYSQLNHIGPLVMSVASLPKEALAEMAESLVNLISFKKRISFDMETVGGPVDVAVISKGDGFIWIKRKHYFDARLNPNFSDLYFRS